MLSTLRISAASGDPLSGEESSAYRRLIGQLLYLQISRPDICYSVHKLSQYLTKPHTEHLQAANHLLRYLKGTVGQGIFLHASPDCQLKAFVDSD